MLQEGKLYIVKAIDHGCPPNAASASPEVGRAHFYITGFESSLSPLPGWTTTLVQHNSQNNLVGSCLAFRKMDFDHFTFSWVHPTCNF